MASSLAGELEDWVTRQPDQGADQDSGHRQGHSDKEGMDNKTKWVESGYEQRAETQVQVGPVLCPSLVPTLPLMYTLEDQIPASSTCATVSTEQYDHTISLLQNEATLRTPDPSPLPTGRSQFA